MEGGRNGSWEGKKSEFLLCFFSKKISCDHRIIMAHIYFGHHLERIIDILKFIWLCRVLIAACGTQSPDQGSNPGPLHLEPGVLGN